MREIRAQLTESGDGMIRGYAAVFNSWSKPISERGRVFREQIKPGALKPDGNLSLWWMHQQTDPLANTKSGTLTVTEDELFHILFFGTQNEPRGRLLRGTMERGWRFFDPVRSEYVPPYHDGDDDDHDDDRRSGHDDDDDN